MLKICLVLLAVFVSALLGWALQQQENERRFFINKQAVTQQAQIEGLISATNELKNSVNAFWIFVNEKEGRIAK